MSRAGPFVPALLTLAALCGCTGVGLFGGSGPDSRAAGLENQGKFREATEFRRQSLAADEARLPANDPAIADALDHLAYDEYSDAIPASLHQHDTERAKVVVADADGLLVRALAIYEKAYGPDDVRVAVAARHLAVVRSFDGHRDQAEQYFKRAVAIYEKAKGPNAPEIADVLADSERIYYAAQYHDELERDLKRVVTIRETAYGPDDRRVADALARLAYAYETFRLRYDLAEAPAKRALTIREKTAPADSLELAQAVLTVAIIYQNQGRPDEAEALYQRAIAIDRKREGDDGLDVALDMNSLALVYMSAARYQDAKEVFLQCVPIFEKRLGAEDVDVAVTLGSIADADRLLGEYDEAQAQLDRVRAFINRNPKKFGGDFASQLDIRYARLYLDEGKPTQADASMRTALAAMPKGANEAQGPLVDTESDAPIRASLLDLQARIHAAENRLPEAMKESRAALRIFAARAARVTGQRSAGALAELRSARGLFVRNVDLSERLAASDPAARPMLVAQAFESGQRAETTGTEAAVAGMAARFASRTDALAKVVRERQDAQYEWQRLDAEQAKAASLPADRRDAREDAERRAQIAALDARLDALDAQLTREFPQYAEIADPHPVSLAVAQNLLKPEEALLTYLVSDKESFLWVVRHDQAALLRLAIGQKDLNAVVDRLRKSLDPTQVLRPTDIPPYDVIAAFDLYQKIFAPAEPLLAGAQTIFVVADGALQSLPLTVLVSARPARPIAKLTDYGAIDWLARRYAMAVLPAVSSLRALRVFAHGSHGNEPYAGFGDPVFDGADSGPRGVMLTKLFRGGTVNIAELRNLPRLPDTADELRAEARILHAPPQSVRLGKDATVTAVKSAQLGNTRIIAFATHGLVAGDLPELAEPALVLTPPEEPTANDQGLLTASDVAQLKLNADWIVLSACNTAAPDGSVGADGLSGLSKAFFYAGARSVLVSHWPVDSAAAVKLTTGSFSAIEANRGLGRSQALQHAMLAMIGKAAADPSVSYQAHPMFWAPFVVVGEGGAGR